jgi:hypothetical protein
MHPSEHGTDITRRTLEQYDNVLGAKINNVVYAHHFTLVIPASYSTVFIASSYSFPLRFSTGTLKRSKLERLEPAMSSVLGTRVPLF